MYNVVIVDDEQIISLGMSKLIHWESLGFKVAGIAQNAQTAMDMILCIQPELILTDIKMPDMDGLEMTRRLRAEGYTGMIILISGYSDFAYAQQALRHGISSYLIKPVGQEELINAVYDARQKLDEFGKRVVNPIEKQLSREKLFSLFLTGQLTQEQSEQAISSFDFDLSLSGYGIVLIQYQARIPSSIVMIHPIISEFSRNQEMMLMYHTDYCTVLLYKDNTPPLRQALECLRDQIYEKSSISIRISVGISVTSFILLNQSYGQAKAALNDMFLYGSKGVIFSDDIVPIQSEPPRSPELQADELCAIIMRNDDDTVENLLDRYFKEPLVSSKYSEMDIKTQYVILYLSFIEKISIAYPELKIAFQEKERFIQEIHFQESIQDLNMHITQYIDRYTKRIKTLLPKEEMSKAVNYILKNYMNPITIEDLAKMMHYNDRYFGRKFKSYTGVSFNDYLDKVRVQNAVALLQSGYRVYQVTEMVGFSDPNQINIKFKKIIGKSPSAFRTKI